ncbi:MAG TPA: NAD(P)-dependent oxidoreductase [Candidatus Binatia bacterium]
MIRRTGYIGIGNIGGPIAANVVRAGFDLMVCDLRDGPMKELAALGAKTSRSPMEVGKHAELVEISVVDDHQVEAVVAGEDGVLRGAEPGAIIAIHSTVHPRTVKQMGRLAKERGVRVVDAAVSGGERGARAKTLCYMVGGEREDFEKCRPVFATSGKEIFHVGPLGMGVVAKAAQQAIVMMNRLSAYEGMTLGEKAGLDPKVLQAVVHASSGRSNVASSWDVYRHIGTSDPAAARERLDAFYKGLMPALELGHELGVPLPGLALTQQLLERILGLPLD